MVIKRAISFLVYSNLWISLGAFCFGWFYYLLVDITPDYSVLIFLFSSTLLTYTFQRYLRIKRNEKMPSPRMVWMTDHLNLVKVLMFISLILILWTLSSFRLWSIILLFIGGMISFLYVLKFNILNRKTNLRDIPGIKIYLIAAVWSISCSIVPFIEGEVREDHLTTISTGFFFYILGITIPFDIRDIELDEYSKKTIPQMVGKSNAKIIAVSALMGSYLLLSFPDYLALAFYPGFALSILLTALSHEKRNELYYSFLLDGLLILLPVSFYLLHNL